MYGCRVRVSPRLDRHRGLYGEHGAVGARGNGPLRGSKGDRWWPGRLGGYRRLGKVGDRGRLCTGGGLVGGGGRGAWTGSSCLWIGGKAGIGQLAVEAWIS